MKLAALLALVLAGCGSFAAEQPHIVPTEQVAKQIELNGGRRLCSATAVAPNWLLTAAHCLHGGYVVTAVDDTPVHTLTVLLDGSDHALVRVDTVFTVWANASGTPEMGGLVHLVGWPEGFRMLYRRGVVAGTNALIACPKWLTDVGVMQRSPCAVILFDLLTGGGDSGAGIFDEAGRLVAVNTGYFVIGNGQLAAALPMTFTAQQWAAIE